MFIKFVVGDGSRVHFLYELWCQHCLLKDLFPDLLRLAVYKEVSIASYLVNADDRGLQRWNP